MSQVATPNVSFLQEDFLLQSDFAKILYHDYVKNLPIIDYHCHLSPSDIAIDRQFENLTSVWLDGDHYKWRAMRTLGIDERFITGNAPDEEKFDQWAYTVPYTLRNPLYHWSHLELKRYFGVDNLLKPETAREIYKDCSFKLGEKEFSARNLLIKQNVEVICTTDDPVDSLDHHKRISTEMFEVKVLPTFRPDKSFAIEKPKTYKSYLDSLSRASGVKIKDYPSLLEALDQRIQYFEAHGCRLSDHGLENLYFNSDQKSLHADTIFKKVIQEDSLSKIEIEFFKYSVLLELGKIYHEKGWTQQFHLGALRNTNSRKLERLGPDTGFDSIGDFKQGKGLAGFLNELDRTNQLAKTILYNLNPADNELMAAMIGNFNDGSVKGKVQYGSAWWFLDQKDGMTKQLNTLSNIGLVSCFIGMITDSRSFLSFPRHEYFRRILCNLFGQDVMNGELPNDEKWLGKIVSDICYHNAKSYFNF
jgi:glucuronate isomerase